MAARRAASRRAAPALGLTLALAGWIASSPLVPALAGLPLDRMPLDPARYCNRSCPAASCSAVCRQADDCASSCTRRGRPVCRCRHGEQT